ncbi:MAG: ABC transporter ATP-binding protein [Chloroflexi bacterium]|jgi:ATP-binding cassette, subfamily B, bacterial|nr:ABC transporter ATP-binding protein [Chloroflexota bacterium]MBT4003788.1 ABC transporter ATP-binding protein [Chloroflexota bacterium]MBT4305690.1 ABC transporter ATP-binding protein [Chloroflexota bacterium]MBT4533514.1 ABC transporter ATP-binding protein [Chloroflexota bacterium]MBT4681843.1 ABC transporter ATP-binding protein [Chloroflexota bacterium]
MGLGNNKIDTFDFRKALSKSNLKGIWWLLSDYKLAYIGATLSLAFSATAKTFTFLLLKFFADDVLTNGEYIFGTLKSTLILIGSGFFVLAVIEGSFSYVSGRLAAYTSENIARRLRDFLFDHIQRLSFAYHGNTSTGELIERVTSDLDAFRRFIGEQSIGMGRIILMFTINFVALISLNVKLGLVSVIVIPFVLLVSLWFFKKIKVAYEKYQEQEAILSTTLQENLTGVRVVKAFARQDYEIGKFEKTNWEKFLRGKKYISLHSLFWPLSDIVLGFQLLGGFVYASNLAINAEITTGTYLAYVGLVVWLIWPIRNLGRLIVQTSTGLVSYGRVLEIVKQEREPLLAGKIQPDGPLVGEVSFESIFFEYEDGVQVLKDINFTVKPGQIIALLGSTGSGKTSLVNLLPRFYDYSSGSLKVDGQELKDYPRKYMRSQIGIVEQEPFLFSRSIRENITYGAHAGVTETEIIEAAKAAAVHDVILSFPDGYDTVVGEKGVTLSGGQKQRVAVARTLLKNPKILILDDSTSSVDTETEAEIRKALNSLMKDRTTFVIAHRIQSVMIADLILVMDKGEIIQKGTHEELLAIEGTYRKIYDIQTRIDDELKSEIANAL